MSGPTVCANHRRQEEHPARPGDEQARPRVVVAGLGGQAQQATGPDEPDQEKVVAEEEDVLHGEDDEG